MIFILIFLVAFAVLAWRDLKLALVLLMGLLPTYLIRFDVGPIPTTALETMILICVSVWIVKHHGWRIDLRSIGLVWLRPMLLLLAAACFAVVVSPNTFAALGVWKAYFIEPILVYLMLRSMFRDSADWHRAITSLFVSACVVSLGAIVQHFTGLGIPAPWDIENRATSLFDFPNAVGLFLAPIVAFAIVLIGRGSKGQVTDLPLRRIAIFTTVLGIIAIIFSQTEATFIAIPAGLLLAYLISGTNKKNKLIALASCVAVAGVLFASAPIVREKLLLQDTSGLARRNIWHETITMLGDHPIFGAGLSGFPTVIADYHDATFYEIFQYPHNIILNIWVELGLLGLLAVTWLGWSVIKTVYVTMRTAQGGSQTHPYSEAAFAALATMVIHGLVDVPYFKNDLSILTWFFLAILTTDVIRLHRTLETKIHS